MALFSSTSFTAMITSEWSLRPCVSLGNFVLSAVNSCCFSFMASLAASPVIFPRDAISASRVSLVSTAACISGDSGIEPEESGASARWYSLSVAAFSWGRWDFGAAASLPSRSVLHFGHLVAVPPSSRISMPHFRLGHVHFMEKSSSSPHGWHWEFAAS